MYPSRTIEQAQASGEFDYGDGRIYLDYTGANMPSHSLVDRHFKFLQGNRLSNTHSTNATSKQTGDFVEGARTEILKRMRGEGEYDVIFAESASDAIGVLADNYRWKSRTSLILARSNHNAVLGMRTRAREAGARVRSWDTDDELRLRSGIGDAVRRERKTHSDVVVAFPAKSNSSGVIHAPVENVREAREAGATVFLDTAAYAMDHEINLQELQADAIAVSFYKMFGHPTGVGALVIRKNLLEKLRHVRFSGGTNKAVHPTRGHLKADGHAAYESGTLNFRDIPAIPMGYEFVDSIGGLSSVQNHIQSLTARALDGLLGIDSDRVRVYGPQNMENRGGIISFNILDEKGKPIPPGRVVEEASQEAHIDMRGGCHCNPGDGAKALGLSLREVDQLMREERENTGGIAQLGLVRASFGWGTTQEEVDKFLEFIKRKAA